MGSSGHIQWPSSSNPIWEFDWFLRGNPYGEGIAIEQAYYRGTKVFWKASTPMARVQYHGSNCGPYDDELNYQQAETTGRCPGKKVCTYSFTTGGVRGLAVEAFYRISAYRIVERWLFFEDGQIYPRIWSGGLFCDADHTHHAYWRFDFDIDGFRDEMVLEYNSTTGNNGWGRGWTKFSTEKKRRKRPSSHRSWAVVDRNTGKGYHIQPDPHSSSESPFAPHTLWAVRYHYNQTHHGKRNHASNSHLNQYVDGEDIDAEDALIWYCGHLDHRAHPHTSDPAHHGAAERSPGEPNMGTGVDEWLHVGPRLVPFRYTC